MPTLLEMVSDEREEPNNSYLCMRFANWDCERCSTSVKCPNCSEIIGCGEDVERFGCSCKEIVE